MLENDVKDKHGQYEGVYIFEGFSDGMDYWVDLEGENALWYKASGSTYKWRFALLHYLGSSASSIFTSSHTLEKKCPNNEGYVWDWFYGDVTTNLVTFFVKISEIAMATLTNMHFLLVESQVFLVNIC